MNAPLNTEQKIRGKFTETNRAAKRGKEID